ncbi:YidB family protein [Belnapia sp. F-4-1]|uniref:YidB family protein n=1 Tax=Belnapia sp. F-4-1 TaxID=1545443 RepID=UPI00068CCEA5|nr:YidB family protein [Belnapia sp. F-4-1]
MSENLFGRSGGGLSGGLSGGMKMAAIALLIQQLMKHSGSQAEPGSAPAQAPQADTGGGLGGILGGLLGSGAAGGLLGGLGGSGAAGGLLGGLGGSGAAGGLLGGLGGLLGGLRNQGLERHVDSWVQHGPNEQVSADELTRAFDPRDIDAAAQQAGTDRGTLMNEVSRVLPEMVDRMTPHGRMPQHEGEVEGGSIGGLLNSIFGGGQGPRR